MEDLTQSYVNDDWAQEVMKTKKPLLTSLKEEYIWSD